MAFFVDAKAQHLLARPRPNQAITITFVATLGVAKEALTVEWRPLAQLKHDSDLVRVNAAGSVAVFMHRRLTVYARWHAVVLTAHSIAWWPLLLVADAETLCRDLVWWEQTHPSLSNQSHLPAA